MSKRVHPGFAAQSGIVAAYLAANSVTGPASIFEAEWGGFFPTYVGDAATPQKAVENLGTDFRIRVVGIKPYAACRGNHSSIDSILDLRRDPGIRAADVERVTVRGNATHVKQLGRQNVETMLDAQFSLPYSIAVALGTGGAMLDQYTPDALRRPDILALARQVTVVADDAVAEGEQPFVDVYLKDGRTLSNRVLVARGDYRNPLTAEEVRAKFRTNAGQVLEPGQVIKLEQAIARVADMGDITELAGLLVPPAARAATRRKAHATGKRFKRGARG